MAAMGISRRRFLSHTGAAFAGLHGLLSGCNAVAPNPSWEAEGYGELVADPAGLLDLPVGFSYQVFSRAGDSMDDGLLVPGAHDGMAAFAAPDGRTILVRNHELSPGNDAASAFGEGGELRNKVAAESFYDFGSGETPCIGGTTTLVYNTQEQRLERHFLSLTGTIRNCAGGPTPWGSWISCEENTKRREGVLERDHGYNFEVPASTVMSLARPVPLVAMGRFNHEAIAVHQASGIIYQTEDREDGLFYRFVPNEAGRPAAGGLLQALALADLASADTRNWGERTLERQAAAAVRWVDLEEIESPRDDLRQRGASAGAAIFARGEGAWTDGNAIYFACTSGGEAKSGQVFRYLVSSDEATPAEDANPGRLELFAESPDTRLLEYADNLTVSPWGDIIVCEDGSGRDHIVGITANGQFYQLGRNAMDDGEFAGSTFSPDGSTLFVNIQNPGMTFAITGPWQRRPA